MRDLAAVQSKEDTSSAEKFALEHAMLIALCHTGFYNMETLDPAHHHELGAVPTPNSYVGAGVRGGS